MGYLLLADSHTFVCRTWDDLAARLVWARQHGYRTAKARSANGYVERPLLSSESARLEDQATRLALTEPSSPRGDVVIVTYREHAIGRTSGVEVEARGCEVWHFRDGQPVRLDNYASKEEGLASVGLQE